MNSNKKGVFLTILGGVLWGFSGVCGQYLISTKELDTKWLVAVRLVTAGLIMTVMSCMNGRGRKCVTSIWKDKKDMISLIMFSLFGMTACQFTYFTAIEYSNAATATVLQYTSPVLIMLYTSLKMSKRPSDRDLLVLLFVVLGTFFLTTHGNIDSLAISGKAVMWGLGSAFTMMLYNIMPVKLMNKYGTIPVIGLSMLIGGIPLCIYSKPWIVSGIWDIYTLGAMVLVVLAGTIFAFSSYLEGVRLIGAAKASMFGASEPLTSAIVTVLFMGVVFKGMDILGLLLILLGVTFLSLQKQENKKSYG